MSNWIENEELENDGMEQEVLDAEAPSENVIAEPEQLPDQALQPEPEEPSAPVEAAAAAASVRFESSGVKLMNRMGFRLALLMVLLVAGSVGISGVLNYRLESQKVLAAAREANYTLSVSVGEQVWKYVNQTISTVKTAVSTMDVYAMDQIDRQTSFVQIINNNQQVKAVHMTDATGLVLASTDSSTVGKSAADKEWFQRASKGMRYVSDVHVDQGNNVPLITISMPIASVYHTGLSYVAFDLRMDVVGRDLIRQQRVGKTGVLYLLDAKGELMAHPDYNTVIATDYKAMPSVAKVLELKEKPKTDEGQVVDYSRSDMTDLYTSADGNRVIAGFSKNMESGWSVISEQHHEEVVEASKTALNRLMVSMLIFIFIGGGIGILAARSFIRPIHALIASAQRIKEGDLTVRIAVDSNNEMGILQQAFRDMILSLSELIQNVNLSTAMIKEVSQELNQNAELTADASSHISGIIETVAQGTQAQIGSVEQGNAAIMQMASSLKGVESNSRSMLTSSEKASAMAEEGSRNVEKIVGIMESINRIVSSTSTLVEDLSRHIGEISTIVEFIKKISGQTNLLALNASIEAARAGEHGRGFTVVANEVKNLADQSKSASEEINHKISAIQTETQNIVRSMGQSITDIQKETKVVYETADSFMSIIAESQSVTREIRAFTESLQELTHGMESVQDSIRGIVSVSQETSAEAQNVLANVEEQNAAIHHITESVEGLVMMADELESVVTRFRLNV